MPTFSKVLKAGVIAGVCGIGLCALEKKMKLTSKIAQFAQSVEAVPFPGTRLYSFLASRQMRPLYEEIADDIAGANDFGRILDLSTGVGHLPIELAHKLENAQVFGLDESADMIRIASADAKSSANRNAPEFTTGDPANLPFPGRYFDLVTGVNVLQHWRDAQAVFDEVYHVLSPGGQFWIYDYRKDAPQEIWDSLTSHLPFMLRLAVQMGPIMASRNAFSESELVDLGKAAHFQDVVLDDITLPLFGSPMPVFFRLKITKPTR